MLIVAKQAGILLVFALAGYLLAKGRLADPGHGKILSVLVLYVFTPCFFMNTFLGHCTIEYLSTRWPMILVCLGIAIPAVIILISSFFLPKHWLLIEAMVFAMPCGMNTVVYPKLIGKDAHLGAGLTMISSMATIVTLPLWVHILGG